MEDTDPLGLSVSANSDLRYKLGTTLFEDTIINYAPVEGVGLLGSYSVNGYVEILANVEGSYNASVAATASGPGLANAGDVTYFGFIEITVGGNIVRSIPLTEPNEPYVISSNSSMIGEARFLLPPDSVNIDFNVNLYSGYKLDQNEGAYFSLLSQTPVPVINQGE